VSSGQKVPSEREEGRVRELERGGVKGYAGDQLSRLVIRVRGFGRGGGEKPEETSGAWGLRRQVI